jgi:hypothetical protein
MDDASEVPSEASSPLNTALDTSVLEASNQAVENPTSFTTELDSSQYVEYGGKVYLNIDKTVGLREGLEPPWIWARGDEMRLLAGEKPQKNWRCGLYDRSKQTIIPVDSTAYHAGEHLRKKHRVYKPGTEPISRRSLGQQVAGIAYQALASSVQVDRFRHLLIRWNVCMYVALSIVEHETFRDLIVYICPALEQLLVRTGGTIRRWVIKEFEK